MSYSLDDCFDGTPQMNPPKQSDSNIGMFEVKSANQWLKDASLKANPKMLFDEFFFEFELTFLFSDTNQGKSVLAVQLGNEIAKTQKVVYFDLELSDKQFQARFTDENYENSFQFEDNFIRIEINPDAEIPDLSFEVYLIQSIEAVIIQTGAKVIIIDNITYLSAETEKAKDALPLMKELKKLKSRHGLSIICLAHTPKRDLTKPITRNDLQGSKMLINFCDSAFAIGESMQDTSIKYLKQIKVRQKQFKYDAQNVKVYKMIKPFNNLHFDFIGYSTEAEHLKVINAKEKAELKEKAIDLKRAGKTIREIARETGLATTTVFTYTKDCMDVSNSDAFVPLVQAVSEQNRQTDT